MACKGNILARLLTAPKYSSLKCRILSFALTCWRTADIRTIKMLHILPFRGGADKLHIPRGFVAKTLTAQS